MSNLVDDSGDGSPLGLGDVLPAVHKSLVAFLDEENFAAEILANPDSVKNEKR
jgi:hypothetical protein